MDTTTNQVISRSCLCLGDWDCFPAKLNYPTTWAAHVYLESCVMEIRPTLHNKALSHPWQPPGQPSPGGAEAYKTPRIDVSGNSGKWLLLDRRRTVYCTGAEMYPIMERNALYHVRISLNSLGPSNAIWQQRSGSTLAQVMACCLTAPSHYLNQSWFFISKFEWHSSKGKFTRDT